MKKITTFLGLIGCIALNAQQNAEYHGRVGINTETPNATLEVHNNGLNQAQGIIAPKVDVKKIMEKQSYNDLYDENRQKGAIVYIENVREYNNNAANEKKWSPIHYYGDGYYYYDRVKSEKFLPQEKSPHEISTTSFWHSMIQDFGIIETGIKYNAHKGHLPYLRYGWGHYYRRSNPNLYGKIGDKAVDLSFSDEEDSNNGATGDYSFAIGQNVKAEGKGSFVAGHNNKAMSGHGVILGYGNIDAGSETSFVQGNNNIIGKITDNNVEQLAGTAGNTIFGEKNKVVPVIENKIDHIYNTFTQGTKNKTSHTNSVLMGNGLQSTNSNQFIIGRYNDDTLINDNWAIENYLPATINDYSNYLVEVVGGGDSKIRRNIFERYYSGAFRFNKDAIKLTNANPKFREMDRKGLHASDENGKLNYHNGSQWETYVSVLFARQAPTTAKEGDMYFNTREKKYYAYDGTEWKPLW